ncbi:MAG: MFS transporter [Chloroflexi bacterium]|nr:MFS transporter [Chloroflexota bacterium]
MSRAVSIPAPRRPARVYYGWWIVAVTFAGTFIATGIHDTVLSVLLKPISEDLGWTRTQVSVVISSSIWIGAFFGPLAGRLMDRHGPRVMTTAGALAIGIAFLLLSVIGQFWQFWLVYPLGRISSHLTMLGSVPTTAVSNWFIRKRGRALGIQAMAIGLGGAVLSLLAQWMISQWGWRSVFVVFGFAMLLVAVVPAALVLRRRPEDIGLLPDGDVDGAAAGGAAGHSARHAVREVNFSVREALSTPTLWLLVAISVISSTGTGAIHLHTAAYLTDSGLSAATAAAVVSVSALVGAFGSIIWGFIGERLRIDRAIIIVYVGAAISVIVLAWLPSVAAAFVFALLFGLFTRGGHIVMSIATANFYGRANLGTIQGIVVPIQVAGLGVGQVFAPMIQEAMGSYRLAFLILAALYLVAAVIGTLVRPPQQPVSAARHA